MAKNSYTTCIEIAKEIIDRDIEKIFWKDLQQIIYKKAGTESRTLKRYIALLIEFKFITGTANGVFEINKGNINHSLAEKIYK